jgi:agmatinase
MSYAELKRFLVDEELTADEPLHASFREKRLRGVEAAAGADAVIFGVPFDAGTYKRFGVQEGPMGIRRALEGFRTYSIELGIDFQDVLTVADIGNIAVQDWNDYGETFEHIASVMTTLLAHEQMPIMLGGDHSISYPAIRAFAEHHGEPVGVIWIDNHYDTMEPFRGDPLFCGCPLRNVLTSLGGLVRPENVVHIGSRGYGNSASSARNARELGFHIVRMTEVDAHGAAEIMRRAVERASDGTKAFYVTVDIDSADVLYAPATQSPRPGGFTSRELMTLVREASVGGAAAVDVVEVAPAIDPGGVTALLAAECVLEAIGGLAARRVPAASAAAVAGDDGHAG